MTFGPNTLVLQLEELKFPSTLPYACMCLIDRCNTIENVSSCSRSQRPAAVEVVDPSAFDEDFDRDTPNEDIAAPSRTLSDEALFIIDD